jgi:Flp pilus assembly protein TadG
MFKQLLRCRRGTTAMLIGILAVPLIGMAALGTEASIWYFTRASAQNAADSAALAGALWITNQETGCGTGPNYIACRAGQFAAQNGFCDATTGYACTSSLPSGTSQKVTITRGNYVPNSTDSSQHGTVTAASSGPAVMAVVTQIQPPLLSAMFFTADPTTHLKTVTITAQAIAVAAANSRKLCLLTLGTVVSNVVPFVVTPDTGKISISQSVSSQNCGFASNDPAADAISLSVVPTVQLFAVGGCSGTAAQCNGAVPVISHIPPTINPLAVLDSASFGTMTNCANGPPIAYNSSGTAATRCANTSVTWPSTALAAGTYFFSGSGLSLRSGDHVTSTSAGVTFILLPTASLSIANGNGSLNISGQSTVLSTQLPTAYTSACPTCAGLLGSGSTGAGVVIYQTTGSGFSLGNGTTSFEFSGILYAPKTDITFSNGNPILGSATCSDIIAKSVSFAGNGNPSFLNSGCLPSSPILQVVSVAE